MTTTSSGRALTSSMQTEVAAATLAPFFAFEGVFESGTLRMWTGFNTLVISGQDYYGAGDLINFTLVSETTELRATGMVAELNGAKSSLVPVALSQAKYGDPGTLFFGCLTNSMTVVSAPYVVFLGKLDTARIEDSGEFCRISISYESQLIDLQRPRVRTYSPQDQALYSTGDKGFDFVAGLQDAAIDWGRAGASTISAPPAMPVGRRYR